METTHQFGVAAMVAPMILCSTDAFGLSGSVKVFAWHSRVREIKAGGRMIGGGGHLALRTGDRFGVAAHLHQHFSMIVEQ